MTGLYTTTCEIAPLGSEDLSFIDAIGHTLYVARRYGRFHEFFHRLYGDALANLHDDMFFATDWVEMSNSPRRTYASGIWLPPFEMTKKLPPQFIADRAIYPALVVIHNDKRIREIGCAVILSGTNIPAGEIGTATINPEKLEATDFEAFSMGAVRNAVTAAEHLPAVAPATRIAV